MIWVVVALLACTGQPVADVPGEEMNAVPATVVEVATVAPGAVADRVETTAVIESESQADVVPMAGGTVVKVLVDEGDAVRKGDVLAIVDNVQLESGAERGRQELERVEDSVKRLRDLHTNGAVSDRELADAERLLEATKTTAREATKTYGQTRLVAPFDGVVAARNVHLGAYIAPGVPAFVIVDPEHLRVIASLPERDLGRVHEGQVARLVSAYDSKLTSTGSVSRLSPVVQSTSGTFRVTISLPQDQTALRPGQFVSIGLEVDRHDGVLVAARKALVYEDGEPVIYRMIPAPPPEADTDSPEVAEAASPASWWPFGAADAEAKPKEEVDTTPKFVAERAPVKIGLVDADQAEILEGITAGDQLIVVGQTNLRDGAPVITAAMLAEQKANAASKKKPEEGG